MAAIRKRRSGQWNRLKIAALVNIIQQTFKTLKLEAVTAIRLLASLYQ